MSLLHWLQTAKAPTVPGLPSPKAALTVQDAICTQAANDSVEPMIQNDLSPASKKRKRESYGTYSDELRAKMARDAIQNGITRTAQRYSK